MPINKKQYARLQQILAMLRENVRVNYTSFMNRMRKEHEYEGETYELSQKTFYRDIERLKTDFKAPIRYDETRKYFYLTNKEWYCDDMLVAPSDMRAALLARQVTSAILPSMMYKDFNAMVNGLLDKNECGMAYGAEIENFQVIPPDYTPKIEPAVFMTVYDAWEQHKRLRLTYHSMKHVSEKVIEPHVFAWHNGTWYLKGRLHRDNDTRYDPLKIQVLAMHRISNPEILDGEFESDPAIMKEIKAAGLFNFPMIDELDIEVSGSFAKSYEEIYADYVTARNDDTVRILLKNIPEYRAIDIIFATLGNVKIHSPESIKEQVREIAEKMLTALK